VTGIAALMIRFGSQIADMQLDQNPKIGIVTPKPAECSTVATGKSKESSLLTDRHSP